MSAPARATRGRRAGAPAKRLAAVTDWYERGESSSNRHEIESAFQYTTSIRVDNPFIAAGISGRGFTNVPVIEAASGFSHDLGLSGRDPVYGGVWTAPYFAMLDDEHRVLIVHNQSMEWEPEWTHRHLAGPPFRYLAEPEPQDTPVLTMVSGPAAVSEAPAGRHGAVAPWRLFTAAGIPAATSATGAAWLIAGFFKPLSPNPYVGLALLLSGIAFFVTAMLAVKEYLGRDS